MKKILLGILVVVILVVGYWLVSPLWRVVRVSEELPVSSTSTTTTLKSGSFVGFDALHSGKGTVKIVDTAGKKYVRFEEDFNVQNGPDLYVGLGKKGTYIKGSELAPLKGTVGSQNYELPEGMDPEEIWIWCSAFSVPFAKAILK